MKKLIFAFVLLFGVMFVSCGHAATETTNSADSTTDSTVVDSAVVDSAVVDSAVVDTVVVDSVQ